MSWKFCTWSRRDEGEKELGPFLLLNPLWKNLSPLPWLNVWNDDRNRFLPARKGIEDVILKKKKFLAVAFA